MHGYTSKIHDQNKVASRYYTFTDCTPGNVYTMGVGKQLKGEVRGGIDIQFSWKISSELKGV